MVQIGNHQGSSGYRTMADLLAKRTAAPKATNPLSEQSYKPKGRAIHGTVEVSGAGKIVNLARGKDLAVPSRMITFPLGDLRCSWQDLF